MAGLGIGVRGGDNISCSYILLSFLAPLCSEEGLRLSEDGVSATSTPSLTKQETWRPSSKKLALDFLHCQQGNDGNEEVV